MNVVINPDELSFKNIFFNDAIKNTVMNDSSFIRILYSNNNFVLNGIFIKIDITKDTYQQNISNNIKIITYIDKLEKYILNTYNLNKAHNYKVKDQINYFIHKLNNINNVNNVNNAYYILKISGIWETQSTIGLTNKFISCDGLFQPNFMIS
jgi:hypothetical protein